MVTEQIADALLAHATQHHQYDAENQTGICKCGHAEPCPERAHLADHAAIYLNHTEDTIDAEALAATPYTRTCGHPYGPDPRIRCGCR